MTSRSLAYLAHRICSLESISKGRLATSIENAVLRVLVAAAVKDKNLRVLEIGTLFGIGLTAIYQHCKPRFDSVQLTAIDPLDGYYKTGVGDIVTDEPVCEQTFRINLVVAGVPEDDCTLIKAFSTEALSIKLGMTPPQDVLIIDGDHSYEGVKADFANYLPSVKVGGYIIFDDYGASDWPGVKEFVDQGVFNHPNLAFIGENWRTAVFQVIK
jgi:predicted O-methyltransferase YrrM